MNGPLTPDTHTSRPAIVLIALAIVSLCLAELLLTIPALRAAGCYFRNEENTALGLAGLAATAASLCSWIAALILLDRAQARGTKAAARNFFIVIAILTVIPVWGASMPIDDQAADLRMQCGIPYIGSLAISCLIYAPMLGVLLTWLIFRFGGAGVLRRAALATGLAGVLVVATGYLLRILPVA